MKLYSQLAEKNTDNVLNLTYPFLQQMEATSVTRLLNNSLPVSLPPQTFLQTSGGPYDSFFLLLEGTTRVYQADENGREMTFYRNFPGDICAMNLHQLFHNSPAQALVRTECAVHGLQISSRSMKLVLSESPIFRDVIFQKMTADFAGLTRQMQRAVFDKLDNRLCKLLKDLFLKSDQLQIKITHQKLANELGTTREVISRSLKVLENKGCLKINRGQLIMVDPSKLGLSDDTPAY